MMKLSFCLRLLAILALVSSGCSQRDASEVALGLAMRGNPMSTARDVGYKGGGLREEVHELFFRADPGELEGALVSAGFVRDDSIPERVRRLNGFKKLVGDADAPSAIGFRRADLTANDGKYCRMLCAEDFSWAYVIYVDSGPS